MARVVREPRRGDLASIAATPSKLLDWIGQSCDLNPIENLWRGLNRIIRNMPTCSNLTELAKTITKARKQLAKDMAFLNSLTDSMPRRVEAVIQANGDVTKD